LEAKNKKNQQKQLDLEEDVEKRKNEELIALENNINVETASQKEKLKDNYNNCHKLIDTMIIKSNT